MLHLWYSIRHFLSKVNESNPNIISISVQEICYYCESTSKGAVIENVRYIDIGLEYLSFYVDDVTIISIRYNIISRLDLHTNLSLKVLKFFTLMIYNIYILLIE